MPKKNFEPVLLKEKRVMQVGDLIAPTTELFTALLYGFANHEGTEAKEYYYWRVADILWNGPEHPEPLYERNPWTETQVRSAIEEKYLSIGGAASSTKSHAMAGYGIISWLSNPPHTLVQYTSTSLTAARTRVWGSVMKLIRPLEEWAPFKIRDSIGSIPYKTASGILDNQAGLHLIASERSRTREAIGKLIGAKAKRVIIIADELSELSPALIEACMSNLSKNPNLEVKAMSNPNSRFDAFGDWSTPEDGWDSVNVWTDEEWRTKYGGLFVRLDGEKSPNIILGEDRYPYLPTAKQIEEDKKLLGPESRGYMRMVRAVFFDSDDDEVVFTGPELTQGGALHDVEDWSAQPTKVAGLDPAFTNNGDRCILRTALVGFDQYNRMVIQFDKTFHLQDDATSSVPRTYQIVKRVRDICVKEGVQPHLLSVDSTGAGKPFCDVLAGEWSDQFSRVEFGGKPTNKRISDVSKVTADETYMNRVTELWFMGKELVRTKQLFGVSPELANEITKRSFEYRKQGTLRLILEPKPEFKRKNGLSPDLADASFLALDSARQQLGLMSTPAPEEDDEGRIRPLKPPRQMSDFRDALRPEDYDMNY